MLYNLSYILRSDKHAPNVTVRKKVNGVPWITEEYICLARERDYNKRQFNKTKENCYWLKFKSYRNKANNLNKKLKKQYYNDMFAKAGSDMNKT